MCWGWVMAFGERKEAQKRESVWNSDKSKCVTTYYDELNGGAVTGYLEEFYEKNPGVAIYYFSKKARHVYTEVDYPSEVYLMFGKETKGLPEELILANFDHSVRIPMREGLRSLNLSNAVAVGAYEALRQQGFASLCLEGKIKGRG